MKITHEPGIHQIGIVLWQEKKVNEKTRRDEKRLVLEICMWWMTIYVKTLFPMDKGRHEDR